MDSNTGVAIVALSIAIVLSVGIYVNAKTDQTAMANGLQECVVTFDYGVKTVWQKECPKPTDK